MIWTLVIVEASAGLPSQGFDTTQSGSCVMRERSKRTGRGVRHGLFNMKRFEFAYDCSLIATAIAKIFSAFSINNRLRVEAGPLYVGSVLAKASALLISAGVSRAA
jgi:hypothetical protein